MNLLKSLFALCAAGMAVSCADNSYNLTGRIDLDRDSLILQVLPHPNGADAERPKSTLDTVVLKNGRLEAQIPDSLVSFVYFIPKPTSNTEMMSIYPVRVLFVPGDKMKVEGSLNNLTVSGTEVYDAYNQTDFARLERRRNDVMREIQQLSVDYKKNSGVVDSLRREVKKMDKELSQVGLECVKSNPESPANPLIMMQISSENCVEAAKYLGEGVRNGKMKRALDYFIGQCERTVLKKANWENLKEGVAAPDFTLPDVRGGEKSLKDFRGKYVVLDFWGIWCGWCVKGIPDMQQYYKKYHKKVEFVSIDFGDKPEKVLKFIGEKGMTWTNLCNGDRSDVVTAYGVPGYPTKIIIDKEGRVVAKFVGEGRDFYNKLDELF